MSAVLWRFLNSSHSGSTRKKSFANETDLLRNHHSELRNKTMIPTIEHDLMISGPNLDTCARHVNSFFKTTQLVHYDSVKIDRNRSICGTHPLFQEYLDIAISKNHKILAELLGELEEEGCTELKDILVLPQGFKSKLLHTISHLLDGFFGIDSRFFDINEVSHWITEKRLLQIQETPESCWLLRVTAQFSYGRGFENRGV